MALSKMLKTHFLDQILSVCGGVRHGSTIFFQQHLNYNLMTVLGLFAFVTVKNVRGRPHGRKRFYPSSSSSF